MRMPREPSAAVAARSVPTRGMPDICKAEVVLLGPKERNGIEPFPAAENVTGGSLTLSLRNYEMLDSNALPSPALNAKCSILMAI